MKIPHAERAIVEIGKLRDYCLDPEHSDGKHKAHQFYVMLGITADDADALRDILLKGSQNTRRASKTTRHLWTTLQD